MQKLARTCLGGGLASLVTGIIIGLVHLISKSSLSLKNKLILALGVKNYNHIPKLTTALIGVGVLLILIVVIPKLKVWHEKQQTARALAARAGAKSKVAADYARNSSNPEITRKYLEQLRDENPVLKNVINTCLQQMNEIDEIQSKQAALIQLNHATYLKHTIEALDKLECQMCNKFRELVNSCIVHGQLEVLNGEQTNTVIQNNKEILVKAKNLLDVSLQAINARNNQLSEDYSDEVDDLVDIIENFSQEG